MWEFDSTRQQRNLLYRFAFTFQEFSGYTISFSAQAKNRFYRFNKFSFFSRNKGMFSGEQPPHRCNFIKIS